MDTSPIIHKTADDWRVEPNLVDYEAECRSFLGTPSVVS